MPQPQIDHNPDLKHLLEDGYNVAIRNAELVISDVPYVNSERRIRYGTLVSTLDLAGDRTIQPESHQVQWFGEYPCNRDGTPMTSLANTTTFSGETHSFSRKPQTGKYTDYYEKMTTYVAFISTPAEALDASVTARSGRIEEPTEEESVFQYLDTASSRAGIRAAATKLELPKVALVGLGGTGSYVLDLVAKTPVKEIHLFDGDRFASHNAYRAPGAASIEELRQHPLKVEYFRDHYSRMHRHIVAHPYHIDATNVGELNDMAFVFLSVDSRNAKKLIVESLEQTQIPFVDVGMGIELVDDALLGILAVTASTNEKRDHVKKRVALAGTEHDDEYRRNVQIADLNALNAALAVVRWKKLFGFYHDHLKEHFSTYTISGNLLLNNDSLVPHDAA